MTAARFINLLKITFAIDAIMALGFGLYSWFFPYQTFGTIIAIPEANASAFLALLSALSLFYVLIGVTCFIGARSMFPTTTWIGLLMIARHLSEGVMKVLDTGKEWLIGNPYPDIIIHAVFILLYTMGMYLIIRQNRQASLR